MRIIFRTAVARSIAKEKKLNQAQIEDMQFSIAEKEKAMLKRIQDMEEETQRDQSKELLDAKMREVYQLKKSDAIIKFEIFMSNMVQNSIKRSTLKTIRGIKEPIFNKQYGALIDQLSSYYQQTTPVSNRASVDGKIVDVKRR